MDPNLSPAVQPDTLSNSVQSLTSKRTSTELAETGVENAVFMILSRAACIPAPAEVAAISTPSFTALGCAPENWLEEA